MARRPPRGLPRIFNIQVRTKPAVIAWWIGKRCSRARCHLAQRDGSQAVIIILNTPGGSLGAMQNITSRMLNARVPVVVFVYPQGAWAGSAGGVITLAREISGGGAGAAGGGGGP